MEFGEKFNVTFEIIWRMRINGMSGLSGMECWTLDNGGH